MRTFYYSIFEIGAWGHSAVIVSDEGLYKTFLPAETKQLSKTMDELTGSGNLSENEKKCLPYMEYMKKYFNGSKPVFDLEIDWSGITDFKKRVYQSCAKIPYGEAVSYGFLAASAGSPVAARAVGGAMASNPFPIVIPCHRVISSDKKPGGFGGGLEMKIKLLRHEGYKI